MENILHHPKLLSEIETFLAESGMGETYFGKAAAKNSELVARLRNGGRVWPETEDAVRRFIRSRRHALKHAFASEDVQGAAKK